MKTQIDREARRRVLKGVTITFDSMNCAVQGAMKNSSETGALIDLNDGYLVPDNITVLNHLEGYKVDCKVIHRKGHQIGVKFAGVKQKVHSTKHQVVNMIDQTPADEIKESLPQELSTNANNNQRSKAVFGKRNKINEPYLKKLY